VVQILAPANQAVRVNRFRASFEGATSSAKPARVRVLIQTGAGTSSSLTPVKKSALGPTVQTSALQTFSGTEPTAGDVIWQGLVPVFNGIVDLPLQNVVLAGGARLGIDILTAASEATVTAHAALECEE
jgi:hypothetical protein